MPIPIERVVWSPPTHAVIAAGDVLVQLWERDTPTSAFQRIHEWCAARARMTPGRRLWMMAVSAPGSPMPNAEARAISAHFPEFFTEFALVIEGSGFRASAARAVLTSMAMMSSRRARPHVGATVIDACETLERVSHGAVRSADLASAIEQVRDELRGP